MDGTRSAKTSGKRSGSRIQAGSDSESNKDTIKTENGNNGSGDKGGRRWGTSGRKAGAITKQSLKEDPSPAASSPPTTSIKKEKRSSTTSNTNATTTTQDGAAPPPLPPKLVKKEKEKHRSGSGIESSERKRSSGSQVKLSLAIPTSNDAASATQEGGRKRSGSQIMFADMPDIIPLEEKKSADAPPPVPIKRQREAARAAAAESINTINNPAPSVTVSALDLPFDNPSRGSVAFFAQLTMGAETMLINTPPATPKSNAPPPTPQSPISRPISTSAPPKPNDNMSPNASPQASPVPKHRGPVTSLRTLPTSKSSPGTPPPANRGWGTSSAPLRKEGGDKNGGSPTPSPPVSPRDAPGNSALEGLVSPRGRVSVEQRAALNAALSGMGHQRSMSSAQLRTPTSQLPPSGLSTGSNSNPSIPVPPRPKTKGHAQPVNDSHEKEKKPENSADEEDADSSPAITPLGQKLAAGLRNSAATASSPNIMVTATKLPSNTTVEYSELDENKKCRVIAGTLPALINKLVNDRKDPEGFDRDNYVDVFLMTHPLIIKSSDLLQHLLDVYNLYSAKIKKGSSKERRGVRPHDRVVHILFIWVSKFTEAFCTEDDGNVYRRVVKWVEEVNKSQEADKRDKQKSTKVWGDMDNLIIALENAKGVFQKMDDRARELRLADRKKRTSRLRKEKEREKAGEPAERPRKARTIEEVRSTLIKELTPKDLAQQMTLVDHTYYAHIQRYEFFNQTWIKHKDKAPNIVRMIKWFNDASMWIMSQIVTTPEERERTLLIKKCIAIAKEMRKLNNLNGVMCVLSALNNSSIRRLKNSWAGLTSKEKQTFAAMQDLLNPDENFSKLRASLRQSEPPVVPFVGLYLTHLIYIDENDDKRDGLLNFNKLNLMGKVLLELHHFKRGEYVIKPIPNVQNFFLGQKEEAGAGEGSKGPLSRKAPAKGYGKLRCFTEKEAYAQSLLIVPRTE